MPPYESSSPGRSAQPTSDPSVQSIGDHPDRLEELNSFFNSPSIKSEIHWFTHRDTLERALERDDRRLYFIDRENQIGAGLMVWCESRVLEPNQAQIRLVAVDTAYRGQGFGRRLVERAIEFSHECDTGEMIADVAAESPAVMFWQSCGFSQIDSYHTDGGRRMNRMARTV